MPKVRKAELSFFYATSRLVLFYISTMYHQNIPKGIWVTERTRNQCIIIVNITKGNNAKSKKGRVVILVRDTSSCPILRFYQVPSKYSEEYSSYRADKKSISNKTKVYYSKSKKARVVILVHDTSITVKYNKGRTPKVRKAEFSFLYAKYRLVLFYISTKYHKNIPKGLWLTERTRNQRIITVKYNKGR